MAVFVNGIITSDAWISSFEEVEDTTSLVDVIAQVKAQAAGIITVYINSGGGVMDEGYAIHDYLRNLGRPIKTIAVNQTASIATVVFLAGDERIARCPLMIHNPWKMVQGDAATVSEGAAELERYEKELEKFYSSKLNIDTETISKLMEAETYISPDQALALGFATTTEADLPAVALAIPYKNITNNKKPNAKTMKEKIKNALHILADLIGGSMNMELITADGSTLTVEREDGDPQVGDVASPDGEHLMADGSMIIVSGGAITEIVPAVVEPTPEEELAQANARIKELEAQITSPENRKILDAVAALGGVTQLRKIVSSYKPEPREGARAAITQAAPAYKNRLNNIKNKQHNG